MIGVFIVAAPADARSRLRADLVESGFEMVGSAADLASLDEVSPDSEDRGRISSGGSRRAPQPSH